MVSDAGIRRGTSPLDPWEKASDDLTRSSGPTIDATDSNMIRSALGRTLPPELGEHWMRPEQIGGLLAGRT